MKRDRLPFVDALRQLAQALGIEMRGSSFSKEKLNERQAMLDAHVAAVSLFQANLNDANLGGPARSYLEERGFTADTIEKFRVGFAAPGWDGLLKSPNLRKFPPHLLANAGLLKPRDNGDGFYDVFRNRLMFPIRNETGQTIAFGGRVMPNTDDRPKYLNSPETPLFSKSKSLYGLDLAKQRIVETRTVAIVEGYTDVMMAHQFGVSNVVAVLGTGLTDQHVSLLRRFAEKIVLLFDADAAGDKAADRVVQMFLTQPIEIAVASIPEGMDPDEYLLAHGAAAFEKVLAEAIDVLNFKWKLLSRRFMQNRDDLTGQQKAAEEYLELLASARGSGPVDPLRWAAALARVSRLIEIPIDELNRRFKIGRRSHNARPTTNTPQPATDNTQPPNINQTNIKPARRLAERRILGILLSEPDRWHDVQVGVGIDDFLDEKHRQIAEVYWHYQRDEGGLVFSTFLSLIDADLRELTIELVEEVEGLRDSDSRPAAGATGGTDPKAFFDQTLKRDLEYLADAKRLREQQKLFATIGRTSETKDPDIANAVELFEAFLKNNSATDLHRIGPIKRSR